MKKNKFYSFCRGLLYLPVKFLFPTKVVNKDNLPLPEKIITVSNHTSILDIPVIGVSVPGYRHLIGKKELTNSKFFAKIMKWADAIAIDRGKADLAAMRKIMAVLKEGDGISMFPEGTRNKTGDELQEVKAGVALFAIKGNACVCPIMLYRKPKVFRKNYLIVGKPFFVAEEGKRADAEAVAQGTALIETAMRENAEYLKDYVENKRWKEIKKAKKDEKRRLKVEKKLAKKALKEKGRLSE